MSDNVIEQQKEICSKYSTDYLPNLSGWKVGVSKNINSGLMPLNGLRHPAQNGTTGWYIWAGDYSEDPNFFEPVHIEHIEQKLPQVVKYLGLPAGWRFQIDDKGHEDVWKDKTLFILKGNTTQSFIEEYIKECLLEDLGKRRNIDLSRIEIDLSDSVGEGSGVEYYGEFLECSSNIGILDKKHNKNVIGEGWIDYLLDENNKLYCYWSYLTLIYDGFPLNYGTHDIPEHVWNELSEEARNYLAKTHQGWSGDERLRPYRVIHYPVQLEEAYKKVMSSLPLIRELNLGKKASEALNSLIKRTEKYLSGKSVERQQKRDVYEIEEAVRYQLFEQHKSGEIIEILNNLEYALDRCQLIIPQLSVKKVNE